jgi:stress response protein YsnF
MRTKVESVSIPVIEEELKLDREAVQTGRVRVHTTPEERIETVSESLLRTEVRIERVQKNEEIDAIPPLRDEGDTVVVPVVEERLVRKLFLVEEVRLKRRVATEEINQQIKLRSQRVDVERTESSGEPPTDDQE